MTNFERDDVLNMIKDDGTHRKQFSQNNGVQKDKQKPTFSVPFDNGLVKHFYDGTKKCLRFNKKHKQYYCFLNNNLEVQQAEEWASAQGTRVFIRNLLSSTVALDVNFVDPTSGKKTECGELEEKAKHHHDVSAIDKLVEKSCGTISDILYLDSCEYICAVPAMTKKGFDLPTELAKRLAAKTGKTDLTPSLILTGKENSAKACALEEKWETWASANLEFSDSSFQGGNVILVDDKYQSGLTMHFIAKLLFENGADNVHGLTMVKTMRDRDNVDVLES